MSSTVKCPKCDSRFRVQDEFLGRVAKCPRCAQKFRLPESQTAPRSLPDSDSGRSNPAHPSHDSTGNPSPQSFAESGSDSVRSTSSCAMKAAPQTIADSAEWDSAKPDTNPEFRQPATEQKDEPSRVEARRASRRHVRRKLNSPAPVSTQSTSISVKALLPAIAGFASALLIGLAGWGLWSMMSGDNETVQEVAETVDPTSPITVDGKTITPSAVEPQDSGETVTATLTSLPDESPEQVAARKEAEAAAEKQAEQNDALKKK